MTLKVWRDGREKTFNLKTADFDDRTAEDLALRRWGMTVKDGRNGAVVARVRDQSPAQRLGLQKGDSIAGISGRSIRSRRDFLDSFRRDFLKRQVLLQVLRGNRLYQVRMGL